MLIHTTAPEVRTGRHVSCVYCRELHKRDLQTRVTAEVSAEVHSERGSTLRKVLVSTRIGMGPLFRNSKKSVMSVRAGEAAPNAERGEAQAAGAAEHGQGGEGGEDGEGGEGGEDGDGFEAANPVRRTPPKA